MCCECYRTLRSFGPVYEGEHLRNLELRLPRVLQLSAPGVITSCPGRCPVMEHEMASDLTSCYEMCSMTGYLVQMVPAVSWGSTMASESVYQTAKPCVGWDLLIDGSMNPLVRASLGKALGASAWEEILTPHLQVGMSSSFLTTYPHLRFREFLCES